MYKNDMSRAGSIVLAERSLFSRCVISTLNPRRHHHRFTAGLDAPGWSWGQAGTRAGTARKGSFGVDARAAATQRWTTTRELGRTPVESVLGVKDGGQK